MIGYTHVGLQAEILFCTRGAEWACVTGEMKSGSTSRLRGTQPSTALFMEGIHRSTVYEECMNVSSEQNKNEEFQGNIMKEIKRLQQGQ